MSAVCRRLRYRRAVSTVAMCVPLDTGDAIPIGIHIPKAQLSIEMACRSIAAQHLQIGLRGAMMTGPMEHAGDEGGAVAFIALLWGSHKVKKPKVVLLQHTQAAGYHAVGMYQRHEQARTRDEVKHGLMGVVLRHRSAVQTAPQAYPVVHGFVSQHGRGGFRENALVEVAVHHPGVVDRVIISLCEHLVKVWWASKGRKAKYGREALGGIRAFTCGNFCSDIETRVVQRIDRVGALGVPTREA